MARGAIAKNEVEKKILEAFGEDAVGIVDKKIIVWANDGGERVQIAITLTCPKNNVETVNLGNINGHDFSGDKVIAAAAPTPPAAITKEEEKNIADLIAALGL